MYIKQMLRRTYEDNLTYRNVNGLGFKGLNWDKVSRNHFKYVIINGKDKVCLS